MLRNFNTAYASLFIFLAGTSTLNAAENEFTGSKSCFACHAEQQQTWQGSHHDLAMQHATEETMLGDFNNSEFTANGVISRFFRKDGKFWVNTDAEDGSMQNFEIKYTFGVIPLQQYLVEFPDGRVQTLGIAWDTRSESDGGQRWFHLYPELSVNAGDELHWTGPQQNWNYMCADCHSTNLVKGYNNESNTFKTTWSDINVGCESCHGPGKNHLTWATKTDDLKQQDTSMGLAYLLHDRKDTAWVMNPATGIAAAATLPLTTAKSASVPPAIHAGTSSKPVLNPMAPSWTITALPF